MCKVFEEKENGTDKKKFSSVLLAGIDKQPKRVTRAMSQRVVKKRVTVRPFLKMANVNHVMPTRYQVDLELKQVEVPASKKEGEAAEPTVVKVDEETYADKTKRQLCKKGLKKMFQDAYFTQDKRKNSKAADGLSFFYQKLAF